MKTLNNRQILLLSELYRSNTNHTNESLARLFDVSERTIRNDIHDINEKLEAYKALVHREASRTISLIINNEELFKEFMQEYLNQDERIPVEPEDRVFYLIRKFLLNPEYLKIDDVAQELYVSRSTVLKDLKDVKVILNEFDLNFERRPNYGIALIGSEKQIRNAISELLFNRNQPSFLIESKNEWLLPQKLMDEIHRVVLTNIRHFKLSLSDIALNNLVIHIAIAYNRVLAKQYVDSVETDLSNIIDKEEYQVAQQILKDIEGVFDISFPEVEIAYVTMHLLGTKLVLENNYAQPLSSVDQEIHEVARKVIDEVDRRLNLGLKEDKELHLGIAIHLKPAIHRFRYQMNLRNPMLEAIKANYSLSFEAAVIASRIIEDELNIKINEDEMGYIALHFGGAMERAKMAEKPLRTLIVCASGIGSSQLLLYKIRSRFSHRLTVLEATELHNLSRYSQEDLDLIISTIPLPESIEIPSIVVGDILGESDMEKIAKLIDQHNQICCDHYLRKELVYAQLDYEDYPSLVEYLSERVWEKGLVNEDISESVLKRETISATAFGNLVAIPHPLEPVSTDTFWTVATLKEPIDWVGKPVQLVVLLNVAKELSSSLELMYKQLLAIVDDFDLVQELVEIASPEHLFRRLKEVLDTIK